MAERSKEFKESQAKDQAKKDKASRTGTPKMTIDDELTPEEKYEQSINRWNWK